MRIAGIDHVNIQTQDLAKLCRFYEEVLGLTVGERPTFDSVGAWLYAGDSPIIHLGVTDTEMNGNTLPVDHVALRAEGLEEIVGRLNEAGVDYQMHDVPGRAMRQLFFRDPAGIRIELNFTDPRDLAVTP